MDFYKGTIPIIDGFGDRRTDMTHPRDVRFGLVPRDYAVDPETMFAGPETVATVPQSEWDARYDEQEKTESSLEHLFLRGGQPAFVNLDQDGDGHCWAYSTGQSMMLDRLRQGLPLVRLNPHWIATRLRTFNGGWCGKSMKLAMEEGCAVEGTDPDCHPLHSNSESRAAQQAVRDRAAKYKVTENIFDLTRQVYDQQMTALQLATCGFHNVPCPSDFNWWGHSVCQVRWVRIERGSWGPLILNSWKGWGRFGLGVLRGSQATANGAVATRVTLPAAA